VYNSKNCYFGNCNGDVTYITKATAKARRNLMFMEWSRVWTDVMDVWRMISSCYSRSRN